MDENLYALAISIIKGYTPEQAFEAMGLSVPASTRDDYMQGMIQLKEQGLTYRQVGEIYGISRDSVESRIRRYKLKVS